MISPNLPAFTTESGSSKMESDISVSGKGRKTGSKEKPFSGVLQFKQGKKQSGQGVDKQGASNRVKPESSAKDQLQGKLGQATAVRNAVPQANEKKSELPNSKAIASQGEKKSGILNSTKIDEAKRLAEWINKELKNTSANEQEVALKQPAKRPTASIDSNMINGKKTSPKTDHISSGDIKSTAEGKITVQDVSPLEVISVPRNSISKFPENGTREKSENEHASKNLHGEDFGLKQPGKNKPKPTAGQQRSIPATGVKSRIEEEVVTHSNAKWKLSSSSINRSSTVTGQNVILNRQPSKPVSRDLQNRIESPESTDSEPVLKRPALSAQKQGEPVVRGGKLNLPETSTPAKNVGLTTLSKPKTALKQPIPNVREQNDSNARVGKVNQPATNTSAKNVELPKLSTPGGELKHAAPTNRERGDSDSRVEKAVQAVKPGAKDVNSTVQSSQVINLKQSIAKGASDAVGHLENSRQPAKSTDSKINLNRPIPVAKNQNNPAVEPQRVESSTSRPAKNGGQKISKVQNDVGKQKTGVRESSSNSGFENTPSLSKKPSSVVTVQSPKADRVANGNGEVHRLLSNGSGDVKLTQVVNRDAKPSVSAEHFNTKANSNLQIPEKGNLSSKVKSSAKPNGPTTSTTRSVVGEKSHTSNSNPGPVIKVLESSKTNVDKVPVERNSPIGSKLQQEIVELGKKLEELPVEGKRTRTQNPSISGQNVPVNADPTRTTAKRTQVIASQLVGASKIIKTIPAKRMAPKQTGLAKRDVKLEQMAKRQPGEQFSNTLGQAKSEFSGLEGGFKGDDMMLAQKADLNGNTQKQNLFFGDRFASRKPTEKTPSLSSDSPKVAQVESQTNREMAVRSDWVNRLAQAGTDLESIQGKLTQARGQSVSTAVMYREIMSAVETFRAMTNNRWSMSLEPVENLRMQLDLRMADSQLVIQARVDRAGHAILQSGWAELQQLLADKEVDLKSLTTQSQKDGAGTKFENQGGRQSGEQKEKDDSWLSRELAELIADFEKESQQPRKATRRNRKPRMAEATFESWA